MLGPVSVRPGVAELRLAAAHEPGSGLAELARAVEHEAPRAEELVGLEGRIARRIAAPEASWPGSRHAPRSCSCSHSRRLDSTERHRGGRRTPRRGRGRDNQGCSSAFEAPPRVFRLTSPDHVSLKSMAEQEALPAALLLFALSCATDAGLERARACDEGPGRRVPLRRRPRGVGAPAGERRP